MSDGVGIPYGSSSGHSTRGGPIPSSYTTQSSGGISQRRQHHDPALISPTTGSSQPSVYSTSSSSGTTPMFGNPNGTSNPLFQGGHMGSNSSSHTHINAPQAQNHPGYQPSPPPSSSSGPPGNNNNHAPEPKIHTRNGYVMSIPYFGVVSIKAFSIRIFVLILSCMVLYYGITYLFRFLAYHLGFGHSMTAASQAQLGHQNGFSSYINLPSMRGNICKIKDYQFRDYFPREREQGLPERLGKKMEQLLSSPSNIDLGCISTLDLGLDMYIYHIVVKTSPYFGMGEHTFHHFVNPRFNISEFDVNGDKLGYRMESREEEATHCDGKLDQLTGEPIKSLKRIKNRSNRGVVYSLDLKGKPFMKSVEGQIAQCLQHYSDIFTCQWPCLNPESVSLKGSPSSTPK